MTPGAIELYRKRKGVLTTAQEASETNICLALTPTL